MLNNGSVYNRKMCHSNCRLNKVRKKKYCTLLHVKSEDMTSPILSVANREVERERERERDCLFTFFLCPHPPLSLTSSSNSPPRHVHSQRCLLPSLLWQSLHLKIWPLMDWKSWGRSNSHLKINVGPVIQKGSQPFLYVHACIYMCVSAPVCVCVCLQ